MGATPHVRPLVFLMLVSPVTEAMGAPRWENGLVFVKSVRGEHRSRPHACADTFLPFPLALEKWERLFL